MRMKKMGGAKDGVKKCLLIGQRSVLGHIARVAHLAENAKIGANRYQLSGQQSVVGSSARLAHLAVRRLLRRLHQRHLHQHHLHLLLHLLHHLHLQQMALQAERLDPKAHQAKFQKRSLTAF
jgi:hypothetical protein